MQYFFCKSFAGRARFSASGGWRSDPIHVGPVALHRGSPLERVARGTRRNRSDESETRNSDQTGSYRSSKISTSETAIVSLVEGIFSCEIISRNLYFPVS